MDPLEALQAKVTEAFKTASLLVAFVQAGGRVAPGEIESALAVHERASNEYTAAVLAELKERR